MDVVALINDGFYSDAGGAKTTIATDDDIWKDTESVLYYIGTS